jgi:PLP dependent protein
MINENAYNQLSAELATARVRLIAVSKKQSNEAIMALYKLGHRDFGENYVQEFVAKAAVLPKDIRWHFIGHLQRNKVKQIVPFVTCIHSIDTPALAAEISKQALANNRSIDILWQVHIAQEETKTGFDAVELVAFLSAKPVLPNVNPIGLMGMASFSDDHSLVKSEFASLKYLFDLLQPSCPAFSQLSMGMSGDYNLAIEHGSTMVRVGSLIFGARLS